MDEAGVEAAPHDVEDFDTDDSYEPSRWRPITVLVLSILGLGVAIYLTIAHYSTAIGLSCPLASAAINCEKVTTSPQSYIFHIPVAVLGLGFFIPMVFLSLPRFWRTSNRLFAYARTALAITGVGFVFYLVHAEFFEIHAICLWCSSIHILTLVIFGIIVTGWYDATAYWEDTPAAA